MWPVKVKRSTPQAFRLMGSLPKACTPSQWTRALGAFFLMAAVRAWMGRTVPISLLTAIRLTRAVFPSTRSNTSTGRMCPSPSGATKTAWAPWRSARYCTGSSTEECSKAVVMTPVARRRRLSYPERMAQLLASVPPEVK